MTCDRSIRCMTPPEMQAKREWRTGACQVRGCAAHARYLVREVWDDTSSGAEEWWEYRCPKHARDFAARHGLELPAAPDA